MKLPSFQFYPGDWMKDPALRQCSLAARGMWTDMLCLMFESSRRGYLQQANGQPLTYLQLARMTGCTSDEAAHLVQELADAGVCSRTEHGLIYSRRLVRDEHKRELCREAGKKGGNPNLKANALSEEERSLRDQAHRAISKAIERGQILPASNHACSVCGSPADHYHHGQGYEESNWLRVQPLCIDCHLAEHAGTLNAPKKGRLNAPDKPEITPSSSSSTSPQKQKTIVRFTADEIDRIYDAYPRKVKPRAAKKAIESALKRLGVDDPASWLLEITQEFANSPAGDKGEFTPHPTTWFNQGRYLENPDEWQKVSR